ncbi:prolyl oligopeptidase family serine peptidase [Pseudoblastomonas halimionae]|uniref:Prolyl oligopeptidase family serine peptidase n=1 Tax=Alteriqipengyuania halimionae TaxID=1926630 RepID=A0A6I4U7S3_9SPHN|nr:prolyl oligopeptidase family serine peptidase [Alteriqipengyuania halimionae]MXP10492.1 prolyl oligopeptidase family serine peptidase [Alteriqipengyuania halimionae]
MIARLALATALVCAATPIAAQETDAEDSYIWLEEIQGERALEQVDEWNAEAEAVLTAQPEYPIAKAWAKQILDDTRQIAMPSAIYGDMVTNLWRDADNPRGIWRIASLESYRAGNPEWRTLIDVDQLGRDEGESYVWHGANCLAPEYTRCLVSISPGGTDADVVREFDLTTGTFVEGGFTLPQAKSNVAWFDEDTLFVGTDEGEGSLTDSGYPRLVKVWKRGTDFADATQIAEGEQADVSISGFSVLDGNTRWRFVNRSPSFWTNEYSLVKDDGTLVGLPFTNDMVFESVLDGQVIARLNSVAASSAGWSAPAGALVAFDLNDIAAGKKPTPTVVFRPSESQAVEGVATSETKLWVKVLDDVSGKLIEITPGAQGWTQRDIDLPANSTIQIAQTSGKGDTAFVTVESMLSPPTLYAVSSDGTPSAIASEPAQFDPSKFEVEQKFATSKDGTKVPYYLLRPKGVAGPLPTLIHAYGGFRAAQTPKYLTAEPYRSGPLGLFWLESGNAYVLANIRGGGEYGPRWHEEALREKRQNSFDDLHAVADDLVAQDLTTPGRIAASGRSNGGVLVGAVANQRPDLYGAIISGSPLIDMRRYNKLLAGASWIAEYGNPDVPEDWAFMRAWSPYQNMQPDPDYPAVFYYLSTLDDRVHPGHARKAAAKLEQFGQTFYFHEYREGGHSVGADHEEDAKRAAMLLAFLNREIGSESETE